MKNLKKMIPIILGVLLLAFILRKVELNRVWEILKAADLLKVLLGFAAFVLMVYIKGIRWSLLLKMQGYRYSVWNCFLIYLNSLFWGNVTPGRAGDFIKIVYLKEDLKQSSGYSMSSVFVDRVFDLYILLVLGGLGLLLNPLPQDPKLMQAFEVFFVVLIIVSVLVLNQKIGGGLLKAVFQRMMGKGLKEKTDKAFDEFHRGLKPYFKPMILGPILLTVASYVSFFWGCHLLASALDISISILYLSFVVSVVNIVSLITFAGFGTREGAMILLFKMIDIPAETALAYSSLMFIVGFLMISLLGYTAYLAKPMKWKGKTSRG